MSEQPLAGRIALITGASRGLGRSLAVRLAGQGAHVILFARTVGALEETDDLVRAAGGTATLVPGELTQRGGVEQLGPALAERYGRLDMLVLNAAQLGVLTPISQHEPRALQQLYNVNVFAHQRLLGAMDPLLRQAPAGRVVAVSCHSVAEPLAFWGGYAGSKAALEYLTLTYAQEVRRTAIRANVARVGPMRTGLRKAAFPGEAPEDVPEPSAYVAALSAMLAAECQDNGAVRSLEPERQTAAPAPAS